MGVQRLIVTFSHSTIKISESSFTIEQAAAAESVPVELMRLKFGVG
nr:MAG TPA: hypothetical protein [Caudoviricetes sp.]